jgi:hypothetical protein
MVETKIILKRYLHELSDIAENLKESLPEELKKVNNDFLGLPIEFFPIMEPLIKFMETIKSDIEEYDK